MQSSKGIKLNFSTILVSAIIGIAATIVLLLAASALMQSEKLDESSISLTLILINIISGLVCGAVSRLSGREGGSIIGLLAGAVYAGVIVLTSFLLDIQAPKGEVIIKIIGISLVCSFIGSKLNLAKSNKKLRKKRKS
ncbi:MAG: TIGR04086 family membrane protein [Oscillospiraceae bacterium]|nr:TIGR04086 family membrane protein [Oscillospiraceae bacterium]